MASAPVQFATGGADYALSLTRSTSARNRADRRRVQEIEHVLHSLTELLMHWPPAELAEALDQATFELMPGESEPVDAFASFLARGHEFTREEQLALAIEDRLRAFEVRRKLLAQSLGTADVARLLRTSRQTPHDRVAAGSLLAVLDRGRLRFPDWQFDPTGPEGVLAGFTEVLRALGTTGDLAKVSWFVHANPYLEERTPIAALGEGDVARVIDAARLVSTG